MNPFAAILAPLLFVPLAAVPGVSPAPVGSGMSNRAALASDGLFAAVERDETGSLLSVISTLSNDVANQVSIEQRLIIRIAPQAPAPQRSGIVADLPRRAISSKLEEKSMGKCVPVAGIAGVQIAQDNKLVLFMRDTRIVNAGLDKGCTARDFYSGFYVARTGDGMMCSGRDKLQSRNGANCKLGKLKQLVPSN